MAGISCNVSDLLTDSKCLEDACTSEQYRLAIEIFVRAKELAAAGGINYANDFTGLQEAAKEWQVLTQTQRSAIALSIDINNSLNQGASFSTDINDLKNSARLFMNAGIETKRTLNLFLKCALNKITKPE